MDNSACVENIGSEADDRLRESGETRLRIASKNTRVDSSLKEIPYQDVKLARS